MLSEQGWVRLENGCLPVRPHRLTAPARGHQGDWGGCGTVGWGRTMKDKAWRKGSGQVWNDSVSTYGQRHSVADFPERLCHVCPRWDSRPGFSKLWGHQNWPCFGQGIGLETSWSPSQPELSCDTILSNIYKKRGYILLSLQVYIPHIKFTPSSNFII